MLTNTLQGFPFLIAILIASGFSVRSQDLAGLDLAGISPADLPECLITCALSAYSSVGQACSINDIACFCKNQDFLRLGKACCKADCPREVLTQVSGNVSKICMAAGGITVSWDTTNPKSSINVPVKPAPTTAVIGKTTPNATTSTLSSVTAVRVPGAAAVAIPTSNTTISTPLGSISGASVYNGPVDKPITVDEPITVNKPITATKSISNNKFTPEKNSTSSTSEQETAPSTNSQSENKQKPSESTPSESAHFSSSKVINLLAIFTTIANLFLL